jgi:hypothetical protein
MLMLEMAGHLECQGFVVVAPETVQAVGTATDGLRLGP